MAFLDSGAQFSYGMDALLRDRRPCRTVRDFYPGLGPFETDLHELEAEIGGEPLSLRLGILPVLLEPLLALFDTGAILGSDLFKQFDVYFDYAAGILRFSKAAQTGRMASTTGAC
jgi:hypothetical protein